MEVDALSSPLSNCKSLTLDTLFNKWILPGIASLLHCSPNLERLVIDMTRPCTGEFDKVSEFLAGLDEENYWSLGNKSCNCLLKHIKTVEIIIDIKKSNPADNLLLAFLQFVLQNAMVLERMVFTCKHDRLVHRGTYDPYELALKLLSFPRSSPQAVILLPKYSY